VSNNQITAWGSGVGQNMGWKVNFNLSTGERVVAAPQYLSTGRLLFVSIVPDSDPCNFGGTSWQYQLNVANGGSPTSTVFDVNNDGVFDTNDKAGSSFVAGVSVGGIAPQPLVLDTENGRIIVTPSTSTSDPKGTSLGKTDKHPGLGRQSWRQLR
jgi:type IV pilus assembly protein PilY1